MTLQEQLNDLPEALRHHLQQFHFDPDRLVRFGKLLAAGASPSNRVTGSVTPPLPEDVQALPPAGTPQRVQLEERGLTALSAGEVALVVLAGGMATRMGGVVKALCEALPGQTFLDLRLAEMGALEKRVGRFVPLWLMTSAATDTALRIALQSCMDGERVAAFSQHLSLRLTPDGDLFLDDEGVPSEHAPGHGDLPFALKESGLLHRFTSRGGKLVMVANIDNLGATVDPAIVGWHLSHGAPMTCEVVEKVGSDRGGIPVRHDERPVILEEIKLPESFDAAQVRVFNTNTFVFDARALLEFDKELTFSVVTKTVDGRKAVQLERIVNEMAAHLETRFLLVPRDGADSRFLPVKDPEELERRRAEIAAVARSRGIIA